MALYGYPHSKAAIQWLEEHAKDLSAAFKEIHSQSHRDAAEPPHGLSVLVPPMTSEGFFKTPPEVDYVYARISTHGGEAHMRKTMQDFEAALATLGGDKSSFTIGEGE